MKNSGMKHCLGALCLGAILWLPDAAGAKTSPLVRELDKMGSGICQGLKLDCRKAKPAPRRAKAKRARKSPRKAARPVEVVTPSKPADAPAAVLAREPAPVPRMKPVRDVAVTAPARVEVVVPREKPVVAPPKDVVAALPLPPVPPLPKSVVDPSCQGDLRASGAAFDVVATAVGTGGCRVDDPVRLRAVVTGAGRIVLPEGPTLACGFALQFSRYLAEAGKAAAALDKSLAKVATGPGFVCRGRNGDASAKLSEHAFGNAVDITNLELVNGGSVAVADAINPASPSYGLLRDLRGKACGYFSTVLGPGTNAAHATHFHFDLGRHGKSATYRICE